MKLKCNLEEGFSSLKILTVKNLVEPELCKFFYKLVNDLLPIKLVSNVLSDSKGQNLRKIHNYKTRQKHLLNLPMANDSQYKNSFLVRSNKLYSSLPENIRKSPTLSTFAYKLKDHLFVCG